MKGRSYCAAPLLLAAAFAALGVALSPYFRQSNLQPSHPNVPLGSGRFFDRVAPRYDFLNRAISLGLDQSWRRAAAAAAKPLTTRPSAATSALDVATGTGDLALCLVDTGAFASVHALDPSHEMLFRLSEKTHGSVRAVAGVAEDLPFDAAAFDAVTVAFGVRNFADRRAGIAEMARVLKSGGRLVVLEASVPVGRGPVPVAARFFIRAVMPTIGATVSGRFEDYRYLSTSMALFPQPEVFMGMLEEAGLTVESHQRLWPLETGPDLYVARKA